MLRRCFLIIGVLLSIALLHAQESPHRFYLLRTGSLLEGSAIQTGNQYTLQTSFGSINVPMQNVDFVGQTKRDVYLYKRNTIGPANCHILIQFAEWCLANGLIPEGIAEYQRAGQVAPSGAMATFIQNRLADLQRIDPLPPSQSSVQPTTASASPTVSKLVFENYVRKVQPVLVNRCASADCHGSNSNQQFKISIPRDTIGSTSRRNLQSVLVYVNLDHPTDSILLSTLTTPHGNMKTALSVESESYIQAVRWVQQVAKEMPLKNNKEDASQAQAVSTAPIKVLVLPEQFRRAIPKEERPLVQELQQPRIANPLDPNVFNEKYHWMKPRKAE